MPVTTCSTLAAAVLALALGAAPSGAQDPRTRRAFEPAVAVTATATGFGTRFTGPDGDASYKNSVGLGLWGQLPLTRRTGLLAVATLSPLTAQRAEVAGGVALYDDVISASADVGLGARLKPAVPVFFFVGGGLHAATHSAAIGVGERALEPQGAFAIGYDAVTRGRWGMRVAFVGHVVKPDDPGLPDVTPKSTAFDWTFHIGGRFSLSPPGSPASSPASTPATAPARGAP